MATNLGVTTLGTMMANARAQARSLSAQETGILDLQLADLVQDAILYVKGVYGKLLDDFYRTRYTALIFTGTTPNFTVDISAANVFGSDINRLRIYDATLGEIPIVSNAEFNGIRSNVSAAQMGTTKGVATLAAAGGTIASKNANPAMTILLYSNAAAAPTTPELWVIRNPVKVAYSASTDTLDAPESVIPLVQDVTVVYMLNRLGTPIPQSLENKVTSQLSSALQQLNIHMTPNPRQGV